MTSLLEFMLAARRSEMHALQSLELTCGLVVRVSALVHALQRERGYSNMFLSGGDQRVRCALEQLTASSQQQQQAFCDCLQQLLPVEGCGADKSRLFNRIALAMHGLQGLQGLRRRILLRELTAEESMLGFTRVISALLALVFEAADSALEPAVTRCLVALFNFMQGKELAGQERATGVAGFAAGCFELSRLERLQFLLEAQQRSFAVFSEYAGPSASAAWQQLCASLPVSQVEALRRVAARCAPGERLQQDLAEYWFEQTSLRLDAMQQVEELLTSELQSLCRASIERAEAELHNQRLLRERLAALDDPAQQPAARLFTLHASELELPGGEAMGQQLERSVLDLLHQQNQRLQGLAEELEQARESLNERKLIERAKGVLMSRHGLGEEAAYRALQNAAMQHGQRLVEVAQVVLRRP